MSVQPSSIRVEQAVLDDLTQRLQRIRLPAPLAAPDSWERGTSRDALMKLITHWRDAFDWRAAETKLNRLPQFRSGELHFVHVRAPKPEAITLVLLHGWPDSFFRFAKVIPQFAELYNVVAPSLPGFPLTGGGPQSNARTAGQLHSLLTRELGYQRFVIAGGDGGSAIAQLMALQHPESVLALHLTDLGWHTGDIPEAQQLPAEKKYLAHSQQVFMKDGAYAALQGTRPRALAPALNDSPSALASWFLDRFHSWSDSGDVFESFTLDELCTNLTLYWVSQTIGSSIASYELETSHPSIERTQRVERPVAVALFPRDIGGIPPRVHAKRTLNVQRWTELSKGSHFAAWEVPELYRRDVVESINELVKP